MNQKSKSFVGYLRVSTAKQGAEGVSLPEQREAILRYAERKGVVVSQWFEERLTAAKRGRPLYTNMLKLLLGGQFGGAIIHKIDRGARHLRDWVDLTDLLDQGLDIYIAAEDLDLRSRGGRLAADIQAVIASDYIRNLRDEAKKGLYGRLKQGVYPFAAPPGYTNTGRGNPKAVHPMMGPLVRQAFELYATGEWPLRALRDEMARRGLRNARNKPLSINLLNILLRNPFYYGLMHVKRANLSFPGKHEPIITKQLFMRAQAILDGKSALQATRHDYFFRRLLTCAECSYALIGERQKGHIYYRCHTLTCPMTGVREEVVEGAVVDFLSSLRMKEELIAELHALVGRIRAQEVDTKQEAIAVISLRRAETRARRERVEAAYFDGSIPKETFKQRTAQIDDELAHLRESERDMQAGGTRLAHRVETLLELVSTAQLQWETGTFSEKREILKSLTSNRRVQSKFVEIEPQKNLSLFFNAPTVLNGGHGRDAARTAKQLLNDLMKAAEDPEFGMSKQMPRLPNPQYREDR